MVLAILLASPSAHADAEYPIVVGATNAVGAGLVTLAIGVPRKTLFINTRMALGGIGLAIMTFGPPIVHRAYGHTDLPAYSIAAHATLPTAGVLIGNLDKQSGTGMIIGLAVGLAAAVAIDLVMATRSSDVAEHAHDLVRRAILAALSRWRRRATSARHA